MIKNLIFDFGQVMIRFERKYMVERFVTDPEDSKLLQKVVFDRLYWDRLDEGAITDGEVIRLIRGRIPERLHADAEKIYYNWIYNIPEIGGMRELIREMRAKFGVKVYLLSNIPKYFVDHKDEIPAISEFDKCIFSSVCGMSKPDRRIYEYACAECGIKPEESIFIDDRKINTDAAEELGIMGYVFDGDTARLRNHLTEILAKQ